MRTRSCSIDRLGAPVATLLLLAAATVAHAQMSRPAPPYLQTGGQFISVGVTFDEAALRKTLPPNVRPTPGFTGGINIYQVPAGYPLAPYSAAYLWADVEGYDAPGGAKGRWMLHGVYGPEPVPTAIREHLGWPVRAGGSRSEATDRGTRRVALLGDREVLWVEIKTSSGPCQPIKGSVNYLSQAGPSRTLMINEIPYVGEACGAEAIAVKVQAPEGDTMNVFAPTAVLWVRELKGFTFSLGRPRPAE